jgi:hypothetical protein
LPSIRGIVSAIGHLRELLHQPFEDAAGRFSGCAISRPRKKIVAFTLSPSSRKRSMCFFLNWIIVLVDLRPELDLFDQDHLLMTLRLARCASVPGTGTSRNP